MAAPGVISSARVVAAVAAGLSLGYLITGVLPEIVEVMRVQLGMSDTAAGLMATIALLANTGAGVLFARWSGLDRARVAMIGAAIGAAGFVAFGLTANWWALTLTASIAGFGSGMALATASAAIAATRDPDRTSGTSMLVHTLLNALLLLALPILANDRHLPMALILAAVFVIGIPLLRRLPSGATIATAEPARAVKFGIPLVIGGLLFRFIENGLWAFTDVIGTDQAGLTEAELGVIMALGSLIGFVGAALQMWLGRRIGYFAPIVALLLLDLVTRTVILMTGSAGWFAVASVLWWVWYVALLSYLLAIATAVDGTGRWAALFASVMVLGDAFGPVVMGAFVDMGGMGVLVLLSIATGIVSIALLGYVARRIDAQSGEPVPTPV